MLSPPPANHTDPASTSNMCQMAPGVTVPCVGAAQPIGTDHLGHVTCEGRGQTSAPMGAENSGPAFSTGNDGHLKTNSEALGQPGRGVEYSKF